MNRRLLGFLCCPDCRGTTLHVIPHGAVAPEGAIVEGEIVCRTCGSRCPVIGSIPRMLPRHLRPQLLAFHADFFARNRHLIPHGDSSNGGMARTLDGFSYQHVVLNERAREIERWRTNFLECSAAEPKFFPGKVGADIGCGEGRHLYWAHRFGAEMIGVDLSEGVETARANVEGAPDCHLVQGDIYHLPLRDGVLDFAYSLGVLHHLPDPRSGFQRVLPALKPGGRMWIWVYGLDGMQWWYRVSHLRWLRWMTARLPRPVIQLLSTVLATALEAVIWLPCRAFLRLPGGTHIVALVPLGDACRRTFRAKIRSVFDRLHPPYTHFHTAAELRDWFAGAGLMGVDVRSRGGRGWIAAGMKLSGRHRGSAPTTLPARG